MGGETQNILGLMVTNNFINKNETIRETFLSLLFKNIFLKKYVFFTYIVFTCLCIG